MANKNGNHKNVIVGAAAFFISAKDSTVTGANGWTESGVALPTGATSSTGATAVAALEADKQNWRYAGYTSDGVEVSYEPDYGEVTVDQALDSVKMFKQGMRVSVNTTFAQATLFNLMVAWGLPKEGLNGTLTGDEGATPVVAETNLKISGGELHDDPVERSLAFVGKAPRSATGNDKRERVYHLQRALQVETSAHSLSRSDATMIPVSFRCLPGEASASSGDYGRIIQRTVTS